MPDSEIQIDKLKIEKLSDSHDLSSFRCDDEELENFLKVRALAHQKELMATTHVCIHGDKVVGFCTISNADLELQECDKKPLRDIGKAYPSYPATLIARLAVSKGLTKKGIGKYMMKAIIGKILENNEFSGCRFIITDSYPDVEKFYEKFGFKRMEPKKNYTPDENIPMYVDIFGINLKE